MCIVSMIHDYFEPKIPQVQPAHPFAPDTGGGFVFPKHAPDHASSILELKSLILEFRRLLEMAKEIDEKTGQPDCVDPGKAPLQDRVADLERLLASPPEFVLSKCGKLEPGTYRVIDGRLYRVVEAE